VAQLRSAAASLLPTASATDRRVRVTFRRDLSHRLDVIATPNLTCAERAKGAE